MKKLVIIFLGIIFVTLISYAQSAAGDHAEPGKGIFKDADEVELVTTQDTKYLVYLQVVVKNEDGQLVNVTESTAYGAFLDHNLSDHIIDTLMGEKEIISINNREYEKVQYVFQPNIMQRWVGVYPIFSEITIEYKIEEGTIEKMRKEIKDYSIWKIQYCASFEGHGYRCLPIFQALVPTMTLEPNDVPTLQWTILRAIN